jgi:hypothetical protein
VIRRKVLDGKTDVVRPNWRKRLTARWKNVQMGVPRPVIQFDESGLTLTARHADGSETKTELRWSEVNGVVAYKRDCFALDLICMGFTTGDGAVELNEGMDGWEALIDAVPSLLPGSTSKQEWWGKVAQPPFAPNPTVSFSR